MTNGAEKPWLRARKDREAREAKRLAEAEQKRRWFKQRDPVARVTGWLNVSTIFVFLATCANAYVLLETDHTLKRTDETARLRDRAFVNITLESVTFYPADKPSVVGIALRFENAGNVPARAVRASFACSTPMREAVPPDAFSVAHWRMGTTPTIIFPKHPVVQQACNITVGAYNEAQEGKREFYVHAEITYLDGFYAQPRVTQLNQIFAFDDAGGRSVQYLASHNCADDDC